MAVAGSKAELLSESISVDTTTTSRSRALNGGASSIIFLSKIENYVAGNATVTIEHSPDGSNWLTAATHAAQSADGIDTQVPAADIFNQVRASVVTAGGADMTVTVEAWYS